MDEKVIYQILKDDHPEWTETKLRNAAKSIAANPKVIEAGVGAGRGNAVKIIKDLASTFAPRKAGGKIDKSKTLFRTGLVAGAGLGVQQGFFGGGGSTAQQDTDVEATAQVNMMLSLAAAEREGVDISGVVQSPPFQQIIKNPNFSTGAILNAYTQALGDSGVYTGKPVTTFEYEWGSGGAKPTKSVVKDTIALKDWVNQFPIADKEALAAWKAKLVAAGVVSASAGLPELKKQWEAWGEYSQEMNKQGKKLTPDQLLDIQRGLWGGGGGEDYSTKYQVNMLKPENVKSLYKSAREQQAGRIVGDEQAAAFAERVAAQQMAKPTKTEYKKIKGKMTPVTTPGYGEAEAAAAALELAKKDPMYAEFQTANVFGEALERALGIRA
jgi:hypothetical protein